MGNLAFRLTGESVITDSARREAGAEAARGGDGEPKGVIFPEVAIAEVLGEESGMEGRAAPSPLPVRRV